MDSTRRFRSLSGWLVLALALASGPAGAAGRAVTEVVLPIAADTALDERAPNANSGLAPTLALRSGDKERLLLRVSPADLAARLGDREVLAARLELFVLATGENWGPGRALGAHRLLADWTETGATWRCPESACGSPWNGGTFVPVATATTLQTNEAGRWIGFDVASDVRLFLAGTPNLGWLVKKTGPAKNGAATYASREGAATVRPVLRVTVASDGGDVVPPTISPRFQPPANAAGWHGGPVEVDFECSDAGSGVAACPDPVAFPDEGDGQSATVTARDNAGNTAQLTVTVRIDATDPVLSLITPGDAEDLPIDDPTLEVAFRDALSGIDGPSLVVELDGVDVTSACAVTATGASCPTAALALGEHGITVSLADRAGNAVTVESAFTVAPPPPAVPVLAALPRATADASIVLRGTAEPGSRVEVLANGTAISLTAGPDGAFETPVTLLPNLLNLFFATTIDARGRRSAPAHAQVTQDERPPSLLVDFPADGSVTMAERVTVSGRVADRLSGFLGLAVTVSGLAAEVDSGIGTNGTFARADVYLDPGPNHLEIVATDALGNREVRVLTVERRAPTGSHLALISGDGQNGTVGSLLPTPVVVRLLDAAGRPRVNQPVTFHVERSDGRLVRLPDEGGAPDLRVVALTDAAGEAAVSWTLGADSGCGNNRLRVSAPGADLPLFVTASGGAAPASQIVVSTGDAQRAEAGAPAPAPLVVWVSDGRNGSAGVPVTFRVVGGGARVDGGAEVTVLTSGTGHAAVDLVLGPAGASSLVEATFPGNPGSPVSFVAYPVERLPGRPTGFAGQVIDNAGRPIGGARLVLSVGGVVQPTVTSAPDGTFGWDDVPAGPAHLDVDGLAATLLDGAPVPAGSFPNLAFQLVLVPEAQNALPAPVRLPPLDPRNARLYDGTADVELTVAGMPGLLLRVKAGSMRRADGTVPSPGDPAVIALNQVHTDDVPMPLPDGIAPPFAWTLQPGGALFEPPIELSMPNMAGLRPGAVAYALSYDHDTERFEIVSSARVSDDGSRIDTDPGGGIDKAGWGGFCPPYPRSGDVERDPLEEAKEKLRRDVASREGTASVALARQILCLGQESCGSGPGSRPTWAQGFITQLLSDIADNRTRNPSLADEVCRRVPPWLPQIITLPPPVPIPVLVNSADVCALAGGISHFTSELLPGFERRMGDQVRADIAHGRTLSQAKARVRGEHEELIRNVIPRCFDRVPELSTVGRLIAKTTIPSLAAGVREGATLPAICRSLGLRSAALATPSVQAFEPPPVATLFSPELEAASVLRVRAPGEQFYLPVGTSVQLSVRDAAGTELAPAASGTTYFVAVGDDSVTISPDGLLTIHRPLTAYATVPTVFYVWIGNDSRLGIGQFAIVPADDDGDGLDDHAEVELGLDPALDSRDFDRDGDGLDDAFEARAGSDPLVVDTDGDGLSDGFEIEQGSDPLAIENRTPTPTGGYVWVGNTLAPLERDGSFRLRNVPISTDLQRVRITGTRGTRTYYARSAFFEVVDQRTLRLVEPFPFGPTPNATTATLLATVPSPTLVGVGATAAVTVVATLADGTSEDVSSRAQGTSFTSSNPEIVEVDPNGLLTARRLGVAFVTARREGVTATVALEVVGGTGTTRLTGSVRFADGSAAADADLQVAGQLARGTSGAEGRFEIPGVAAGDRPLTLLALARVPRRILVAEAEIDDLVVDGTTAVGTLTLSSASLADLDADGLPDVFERLFGFDPTDGDGDDDGIADGFEDRDSDGLPDWGELVVGSDPDVSDSDHDEIVDGQEDSDEDGLTDGFEALTGQNPLEPEAVPPTVEISTLVAGSPVVAGSTIEIRVRATDDVAVVATGLRVNGVEVAEDPREPYVLPFTLPLSPVPLVLEATATDVAGNLGVSAPLPLEVTPVLGTTASGLVLDATELPSPPTPVAGAEVALRAHGLSGEFFDFVLPLTDFPDLTGLTPDVSLPLSALNVRNPAGLLAPDPFGVGLAPDFAARFRGTLTLPQPGFYAFLLGSDDAARLTVDGVQVATVSGAGTFTEVRGEVALPDGDVAIEVLYYHGAGHGELRVRMAAVGGVPESTWRPLGRGISPAVIDSSPDFFVPTAEIRVPSDAFVTTSGIDGTFALTGIPTLLQPLQAEASAVVGGGEVGGRSALRDPVGSGTTDLGSILLGAPGCVFGEVSYGGSCRFGPLEGTVELLVENETGTFVLVERLLFRQPGSLACLDLRRRQRYKLRQTDVACSCGPTATCESAPFELTLPTTTSCQEGSCEFVGTIAMTCDFFCGS